jgi:NAD(P)-dependent dehydrogenase (short-subunit alcohol dehydrogenase family)
MKEVILVTGASSGFGLLAAQALAKSGHTVYACMRETRARNAPQAAAVESYAREHKADLRTVELDVQSDACVRSAIEQIVSFAGRLDVIVHNAGHSCRGGTPPFLAPYFAAKAAMDSLAVSYASEISRWGIETSIVIPGAFTKGTNHFAHSGKPADTKVAAAYEQGPYAGVAAQALKGLASLEPPDADAGEVARAIAAVVNAPFGKRPFRVYIDPSQDGAEEVFRVGDRIRREMFRSLGLQDLLTPRVQG